MSEREPFVELQNAGLFLGGKWLVRGVDLHVGPGEIVTLIGPNGSGKSTTAKLAIGLKKPSEGEWRAKENLRVGYVPQRLNIDWTLPLPVGRFMQLTHRLKADEVETALQRTGVSHLINSEVRSLSGGEFQRVMLARAVARQPDLLVLDEPVQGVDFVGEVALYELIDSIRNETQCGVLLISHDLHLVMAATDRVICLNGHMCCQGTPESVAESGEYRALFGDRAAAAIAVYQHDHDHTHLPDGRVVKADGSIVDSCDDQHDHSHAGADHV